MAEDESILFSEKHSWCRVSGKVATVGLSDFAQKQLKDIVFAELPKEGNIVEQGKSMAVVESVKSVSDVYAPVSGKVVEVNKELEANPSLINSDPLGKGWIAKIEIENQDELGNLLPKEKYKALVEKKREQ